MARRLARYLEFFHAIPVKVFNYNEYRRKTYGKVENFFFDSKNLEAMAMREKVYAEVSLEIVNFMKSNPQGVAILDSTNATFQRRNSLASLIHSTGAKMMFVEVSNNDEKSLNEAYIQIIKGSPDYEGIPADIATADFKQKIAQYQTVYETIDSGLHPIESTWNYIKCDLQSCHFTIHNVRGYLQQKISHFLMNLRTEEHIFYLSRHGQSDYNAVGRIGGDSGLSKHGLHYAKKLAEFTENVITKYPAPVEENENRKSVDIKDEARADAIIASAFSFTLSSGSGSGSESGSGTSSSGVTTPSRNIVLTGNSLPLSASPPGVDVIDPMIPGGERPARLWTSTMRRTKETAQFIRRHTMNIPDKYDPTLVHEWVQMRPRAWHHLDELFAGACDGMTYEEIEEQFPEEFARRSEDKLAYRYPRGESYLDVIARLEPMIIEMERHREPLLIIGHQGILRIIYAFYMGLSRSEAPFVSIPLNTVLECKPGAFACSVDKHVLYKIILDDDGQNEPIGGGGCATFPADSLALASLAVQVSSPSSSGKEGSVLARGGINRSRTTSVARPVTEEEVNNPHSH